MEKATFAAIKTQLLTYCANYVKHVGVWNNQIDMLLAEENTEYPWPLDAVFIEFPEGVEFSDIGDGRQLAEQYDITIHTLSFKLNETDGQMEENFDAFTTKKEVYKALQFFRFPGSGPMNRLSETPDHMHGNIYHFAQVYRTTWHDTSIVLPRDGEEVDPPFTWPPSGAEYDN